MARRRHAPRATRVSCARSCSLRSRALGLFPSPRSRTRSLVAISAPPQPSLARARALSSRVGLAVVPRSAPVLSPLPASPLRGLLFVFFASVCAMPASIASTRPVSGVRMAAGGWASAGRGMSGGAARLGRRPLPRVGELGCSGAARQRTRLLGSHLAAALPRATLTEAEAGAESSSGGAPSALSVDGAVPPESAGGAEAANASAAPGVSSAPPAAPAPAPTPPAPASPAVPPGGEVVLEDLPLTPASVEAVLTEVRPYLVADGGDVELAEIVGSTVYLRLQGACGSCPSSSTTMALGLKRRLMEAIPAVEDVKELLEHDPTSLELSEESVEGVLAEIRPYLVGAGGGDLSCESIDDANIVTVRVGGSAAKVTTVRVAIAQKLRERIPKVAAVRIVP